MSNNYYQYMHALNILLIRNEKGDGSMIYMDNAATTRLHPEVINAMLPYMGKRYANPSGAYTFSADVKTI